GKLRLGISHVTGGILRRSVGAAAACAAQRDSPVPVANQLLDLGAAWCRHPCPFIFSSWCMPVYHRAPLEAATHLLRRVWHNERADGLSDRELLRPRRLLTRLQSHGHVCQRRAMKHLHVHVSVDGIPHSQCDRVAPTGVALSTARRYFAHLLSIHQRIP